MGDYTLAIGDGDPYGFSAPDDRAALAHACDYIVARAEVGPSARLPVALSGPDGLLTASDDDAEAFCRRTAEHRIQPTDDVRPGDPTPPDCNMA